MKNDQVLGAIVFVLAVGSFALAIIDPTTRPAFDDLTKFSIGILVGTAANKLNN